MNFYNLSNRIITEIKSTPFKLEKDIQQLVEGNFNVLFDLDLVKSEFQLNNLRIDTLGFDQLSKSFVIIEYKKRKSFSVIDQGYAYLSLLLNNKADFILEYQEQTGNLLRKNDVDWSQSRVLFVAPQFTNYQKQSIEFKDLPFELWEIRRYENETISLNQHISSSQESIDTVSTSDTHQEQVNKEIKVYTEEDHYKDASEELKELYFELKDRISELGNIDFKAFKHWINFKQDKRILGSISFQKSRLKMWLNISKGKLDDPKGFFRDVSNVGHLGIGDYEAGIDQDSDLDYLMSLVNQSYKYYTER